MGIVGLEANNFLNDSLTVDVGHIDVEGYILHVKGAFARTSKDEKHGLFRTDSGAVHEPGGDLRHRVAHF